MFRLNVMAENLSHNKTERRWGGGGGKKERDEIVAKAHSNESTLTASFFDRSMAEGFDIFGSWIMLAIS